MALDTPARSSIIALGLTIEYEGAAQDVVAELPSGATVDALTRALAVALPALPPSLELTVQRTGERLPADAVAMDRDLRGGDRLTVERASVVRRTNAEPLVALGSRGAVRVASDDDLVQLRSSAVRLRSSAAAARPVQRLAAASGPAVTTLAIAGLKIELPAGEFRLGSAADCDVVLGPNAPAAAFDARCAPGQLAILQLAGGPAVSIDGTVVGADWTPVPDGATIRAAGLLAEVSLPVPQHPRARTDRMVIGDELAGRPRIDLDVGGEISIHRPPRRGSTWRPVQIELPETPRKRPRVRLPLVASLVPLIGGLVMFLIVRSPMMLGFMALSPMMAAGTYFSDRRARRSEGKDSAARFEGQLAHSQQSIASALTTEAGERREAAPPVTALLTWADRLGPRLWERRPWDADFMDLRLGLGDLPATTQVQMRKTSSDVEPDERLQGIVDSASVLAGVPCVVGLQSGPVLGLAGHRTVSSDVARALVLQAVTLHSPLELGVVAALPPGAEEGWNWLKWLPHTQTAGGLLDHAPLGTGRRAIDLLRRLRDAGDRRLSEQRKALGSRDEGDGPALLILIDEQLQLDRSLVSDILGNARALRYSVIWIGRDPRSLPGECATTVDCGPNGVATVATMADHGEQRGIRLEGATIAQAEAAARALAPTRDATLAAGSAAVPARVKLLEQLQLTSPRGEQLAERWQRRRPGLGAAIGMAAGEPLSIDLRTDGPHALIAGTTGAGKSELLRTIVASLAAAHPPSRLTFLLIDYKGGAAFAPCAALPHVLDVVSDLDAELGERALVSLDAEMKYREHLLADTRADNLIDLERRAPELAPPNLVIMVDEFAKLRDEIPEFVDGVVDVAQRGRTLGIHMVLAAQSLRSSFTPAVRANTNLRIALRVTSDTESQDVIEANDAARIPSGETMRGRAYARIGHDRLIEFQSAHVSGRHLPPGDATVVIRDFAFDTLPVPSTRRAVRDEAPPRADETDLAAVTAAAAEASELLGLATPRPAWTQPLPERLERTAIQRHTSVRTGRVAMGLIDEPRRQRQVPLTIDLDQGHLAIFGAGGTGKTVALQTIAAALACDAAPGALQIYGIDADAGPLSLIEPLPHVASVVGGNDAERIERLIERLEHEMQRRSALHAAIGAGSLTDYLDSADAQDLPRIVLMIDGFGEFSKTYDTARVDSLFDRLIGILAGGRGVGIHVIVTADRRQSIRSAVAASFQQRVLLRQASTDDLVAFGVPSRVADRVRLGPGRAFTMDQLVAQIALPSAATGASDGGAAFRLLAEHLAQVWPDQAAPGIDTIPDHVGASFVHSVQPTIDAIPVGIGGGRLEPVTIDVGERHFLAVGGIKTGRTTTLRMITEGLTRLDDLEFIHLLAPRRSALSELGCWNRAARGLDACHALIAELAEEIIAFEDSDHPRGVIIVDDAGEFQSPQVLMALERIVRFGRDRGVRVIAAAEQTAARALGNLWLRELRRDGNGLLLAPDPLSADGDILSVTLPRRSNVAMVTGRGYLVARGGLQLVQIALPD